ncbi:hypothetical protein BU17DRAFT_72940 [Hysterangium stoloniferum]|nr:hypothetical protein BU17DRAFT_72940 [Hysterangium stoloniferum]
MSNSTNPSHILIARNSRSSSHAQSSSISSPEVETAAASGVFRSSGEPPWLLEECGSADVSELEFASADDLEDVAIDETFTRRAKWPGTVKIIVESVTFWAHKDILLFASPFFEAALSGNWSETGRSPSTADSESHRPLSMSSVITISQPPTIPDGDKTILEPSEGITFAPAPVDSDGDFDDDDPFEDMKADCGQDDDKENGDGNNDEEAKRRARVGSLEKLQGQSRKEKASETLNKTKPSLQPVKIQSRRAEAIIVLKEEKASTFHDFLRYVYPHLDCTITCMNISHKLVVPSLQSACLDFLLTHAAGKPIKAMRIAELFEEEDLYRESSRFVLDNPGGWSDAEIQTLSQETLLKLEKRRNWFLERVLKLGLTNIAKEYQCCSTCPDPTNCARLLEEKWRQAYQAVFRFGPCQPSMVHRYLRTLEGISPPLSLTHLSCQTTAKSFTATHPRMHLATRFLGSLIYLAVFDRMFSLGVRGSGTDTAPLGVRVAGAASGPRRHFLYCSLKSESNAKARKSKILD